MPAISFWQGVLIGKEIASKHINKGEQIQLNRTGLDRLWND